MRDHHVVIGAGISGMSCALALAKAGRRVTLIESQPRTGSLIRGFRRGGMNFDGAFHYAGALMPGEYLADALDQLGVYDDLTILPLDETCCDRIHFEKENVEVAFPQGWAAIRDSLSEQFPDERAAIASYLDQTRAVYTRIADPSPEKAMAEDLLEYCLGPSLQSVLDELTSNIFLKEALISHSMLYGSGPRETPFAYHARVVGGYYESMAKIQGGGTAIANALTAALTRAGVEIWTRATVTSLQVGHSGRVEGVLLDNDEFLAATTVVYSGHPQQLLPLLASEKETRFHKRIRNIQHTCSANILFCRIDTVPHAIDNRNSYVRPSASIDLHDLTVPDHQLSLFISPSDDATFENLPFSVTFPADASAVSQWVGTSKYNRPDSYREYKTELTERLAQRLRMLDGFADAAVIGCATPLTVGQYYDLPPSYGLYGAKHIFGQISVTPRTVIPNLHLCGQAVTGPGLFGGVYSGLIVAKTAIASAAPS